MKCEDLSIGLAFIVQEIELVIISIKQESISILCILCIATGYGGSPTGA